MPQKSRKEDIIGAVRKYLKGAVKGLELITDEQLMKVANCARATFYKYVTKDSAIELEIESARIDQKRYAESKKRHKEVIEHAPRLRKTLEAAEAGNRELLVFISRMTANLIMAGVPIRMIQAAQQDAMPHPNRSFSHTGRGRRRK